MMVRVMYPDGSYDIVRNDILDILVANSRIKKFRRSSGWVDIDRDQIRSRWNPEFLGPERRADWPELA